MNLNTISSSYFVSILNLDLLVSKKAIYSNIVVKLSDEYVNKEEENINRLLKKLSGQLVFVNTYPIYYMPVLDEVEILVYKNEANEIICSVGNNKGRNKIPSTSFNDKWILCEKKIFKRKG